MRAQNEIFRRFEDKLSDDVRRELDALLEVSLTDQRATLFKLKDYPPEATPITIASYIDRYRIVLELGVDRINVEGLTPGLVRHLARLIRRYDADHLKRFSSAGVTRSLRAFLSRRRKRYWTTSLTCTISS